VQIGGVAVLLSYFVAGKQITATVFILIQVNQYFYQQVALSTCLRSAYRRGVSSYLHMPHAFIHTFLPERSAPYFLNTVPSGGLHNSFDRRGGCGLYQQETIFFTTLKRTAHSFHS